MILLTAARVKDMDESFQIQTANSPLHDTPKTECIRTLHQVRVYSSYLLPLAVFLHTRSATALGLLFASPPSRTRSLPPLYALK